MTAKKQKEKDRRRARRLAEEAWEAAAAQNLDLAEKIIRRAVATQPDNPVLWNDQGALLAQLGKDREAEKAFRGALRLAPTYAEAYANLAALRARQGALWEAVALQTQAVQHAPDVAAHAQRLEAYRAQSGRGATLAPLQPLAAPPETPVTPEAEEVRRVWRQRVAALDWPTLGAPLTREGCVLIPGLVDAGTCAGLRALFDDETLFARTVVMDKPDFGQGEYRYFRAPLPPVVDALRRAVYPHAARIANGWRDLLGSGERYPEEWEEFRAVCAEAGQTSPTPILLKYGPGGFNALHRDLHGVVFFPIQLAVVLSPQADPADPDAEGFRGGEFLFCDVPESDRSRRRSLAAGLGDAVLFCTRDRLVPIGGVHGLQPVKHGVGPITAGTRLVLGLPFHEYR